MMGGLEYFMGFAQQLIDFPDATPDAVQNNASHIITASNRAAALTRQLLAFGRKQVLQPSIVNLNAIIVDVDKMARRLISENVEIVARPAPKLGEIKTDPGQIEQVLLNLLINARDAMPHGGTLTLETANVELDQAYADEHAGVRPGPYVMLAVSDTGVGMDADTQAHIFEPFFTTKEMGKGSGMGLATVYGVVQQSGGHVSVYSEPGRGSTFKVYLPRTGEVAAWHTARGLEWQKTLARPLNGTANLLTKVTPTPSTCSAPCTTSGWACHKTSPRPFSGTARLLIRAVPMLNTGSA